jgi:hypothetical protein
MQWQSLAVQHWVALVMLSCLLLLTSADLHLCYLS